jgi:hypothetical protein
MQTAILLIVCQIIKAGIIFAAHETLLNSYNTNNSSKLDYLCTPDASESMTICLSNFSAPGKVSRNTCT